MNVLINQKPVKSSSKKAAASAEDKMDVADHSPLHHETELHQLSFQLDKICRILALPVDAFASQEEVFEGILSYFHNLQKENPSQFQQFTHQTTVFPANQLQSLNKDQLSVLRNIQQMTFQVNLLLFLTFNYIFY
jgi:hypothetical protein